MKFRHVASRSMAAATVLLGLTIAPVAAQPTNTGSISGTVTAQSGATPIANATVYVRPHGSATAAISGVTAADGTYTVGNLARGQYDVVVVASGYSTPAPGFTSALLEPAAAAITGVDFGLVPSSTITGVVKDASGNPVSGATVYAVDVRLAKLLRNFPPAQMTFSDFVTKFFTLTTAIGFGGWLQPSPGSTVTGADGSYSIDGLVPGTYFVRTSINGRTSPSESLLTLSTTASVNLTFPAGATIMGKVTNADGSPVAGMTISALSPNSGVELSGLPQPSAAVTQSDGTYSITGVKPGTVDLWPIANNQAYLPDVTVNVPNSTSVVGFSYSEPGSGSISGTVTNQLGEPVAGATVLISGGFVDGVSTSDANGHYSVEGLSNDTYLLQVVPSSYGEIGDIPNVIVSDATPAAVQDVVVTRLGTLSGHVYGPDKKPVFGAIVTALPTGGAGSSHVGQAISGPDGSYVIPSLAVDTYNVTAEAPDWAISTNAPLTIKTNGEYDSLDVNLRDLSFATVPAPPTAIVAAGAESVKASGSASGNDGGNPVDHTNVTISPGNAKCVWSGYFCTATGLKDDTLYTVRVTSVNRVGASKAVVRTVRTRPTASVTKIKVTAVKGGKAIVTFKAPHTTGVIVDYALHYLSGGKWKVYKHKASIKPVLTVAGLGSKKSFKAFIVPLLKQGRASNSAYFTLKTG